ncbi:MAG TPA: EAL domain-containing protein [Novosphingobium sp.]|nr:EAL domain-containing protein [Novosphingobium sp.]
MATLYTQPASLALGAISCSLASLPAAMESHRPAIVIAAALQALVGVARVILGYTLPRTDNRNARRLELLFEVGAFSFAGLAGLIGALAMWYDIAPAARVMAVVLPSAYGAGIAARNAGRPAIAIGQMLFALGPQIIVGLIKPEFANKVLGITTIMLLLAMISITRNTFRTLRDSISAAETSQRLAEKMQQLARTDVVTGLLNRAGLNHQLVEKLMGLHHDSKLALFWLDLDRFKEINDTLGHQVGDRLLAEVAHRLRKRAPEDACVARFGGDEFIVACEAAHADAIRELAEGLLEDITRPIRIDDDRIEIGCSIGIAVLPDDGADLDSVMQGADLALYQAKINGRKQITFFDPSMTRSLVRRKEIETELRLALQRDELSVFFQPLIDLQTGKIRAFEALVRWFHPEKGELRPDEFIPVAEETGAIITLGNWITAQAARVAATWPDDVTVAVNLSPVQIRAPGAALGILTALREARLPPERLELEITETVLLDHSPNTTAFIEELSAAGVRFALDDFGTGYSSLGYLNKYPFKKIKIDRSFVSGINAGPTSAAVIRAVSGMGLALGMEIVAEGLETPEQVEAVRQAGCTLGQGWIYSRAVPDYLAAMLLVQEPYLLERPATEQSAIPASGETAAPETLATGEGADRADSSTANDKLARKRA